MVQHSDAEAAIIGLPHGGDPTVLAGDYLDGAIEKADISVFRTGSLDAGETKFGQIIPTGGRHHRPSCQSSGTHSTLHRAQLAFLP
jgi:hypothetical protein